MTFKARVILPSALLLINGTGAVAQATGAVAGIVRADTARVTNARVTIDTTGETRSDSLGRFEFRDVPTGRHTVEVRSLGALPVKLDVIVAAGETIEFEVRLEKIVTLDSVLVEGNTVRQGFVREHDERKKLGMGKFLDSTQVKPFFRVAQAISFVPGVRIRKDTVLFAGTGGDCVANLWIDNEQWGSDALAWDILRGLSPGDVMAVEVYLRDSLIPEAFRPRGKGKGCGALVVWTRRLWPQGKGK